MDSISPERRSWNMSRIRGSDTRPEMAVRSLLHRAGFRFRLHVRGLPGRPDIVLPRHRTVVFVHGCFWHRHPGCRCAYNPKTRRGFWQSKFRANRRRDSRNLRALQSLGWRTIVVWECELAKPDVLAARLMRSLRPGGKPKISGTRQGPGTRRRKSSAVQVSRQTRVPRP